MKEAHFERKDTRNQPVTDTTDDILPDIGGVVCLQVGSQTLDRVDAYQPERKQVEQMLVLFDKDTIEYRFDHVRRQRRTRRGEYHPGYRQKEFLFVLPEVRREVSQKTQKISH